MIICWLLNAARTREERREGKGHTKCGCFCLPPCRARFGCDRFSASVRYRRLRWDREGQSRRWAKRYNCAKGEEELEWICYWNRCGVVLRTNEQFVCSVQGIEYNITKTFKLICQVQWNEWRKIVTCRTRPVRMRFARLRIGWAAGLHYTLHGGQSSSRASWGKVDCQKGAHYGGGSGRLQNRWFANRGAMVEKTGAPIGLNQRGLIVFFWGAQLYLLQLGGLFQIGGFALSCFLMEWRNI